LLLLTARERARAAPPRLAHDGEQLVDALERLARAGTGSPSREPEPEVLVHRQLAEDPAALRHERYPAPRDLLGRAADERTTSASPGTSASGRPAAGSSRSTKLGSVASARATPSRRSSPCASAAAGTSA